ncbi:MAG: gliding motility-associated C-terminal domain-containing protein [Bacteroidota bacterium]
MKKLTFLFLFFCHFLNSQDQQVWMHPNRGQWHENVRYKIELANGQFLIEQNAFTYHFHNVGELMHSHAGHQEAEAPGTYRQHVIKSTFLGSNPDHGISEGGLSEFYRNYFIGNDQSRWKSDIYSCSEVRYTEFYENTDLLFESGDNAFKYSFILQPHADAAQIRYRLEGADRLSILKNGSLEIRHSLGSVTESRPIAWTLDENGRKTPVKASYKLDNNVVSFDFPEGYNHAEKLIIDPEITFSTYTGSSADNWGCTATPDNAGNLYAGGTVFGPGYPVTAGAYDGSFNGGEQVGFDAGEFDIGLSKFNATGTALLYSTYIGGMNNESPNSMVVNEAGELYIMGVTSSPNFTSTGNGFDNSFNGGNVITLESNQSFSGTDIYVIKMSAAGNAVLNATFMGGSDNDGINMGDSGSNGDLVFNYGDTFRGEIILDPLGNVLVASSTRSSNFPTVNPSQAFLAGTQDAVLFKLNPTLNNLLWSTYYGGSGLDCGNALALNSVNEVYMTGGTLSSNLAVPGGHAILFTGGEADGYVTRFNAATGGIMSGTYIGTQAYDQSFFVQIDPDDFVYVYGQTYGNMPVSGGLIGNPGAQQFIRKYNQALSSVVWNTKIGGSGERISPTAFLVSTCYEIYLAGWGGNILGSDISGFTITPDAFQTSIGNGDGFYIAVLDPDAAALQYGTFIGGSSSDHVDGGTSRFDKNGNIYHAVCSSCGSTSNGFVTTPGAYATSENSGNCNLAAFKFELNSINAGAASPSFVVCLPNPVQFSNNSTGGDTYLWDFGDGTFSTEMNPEHEYVNVGEYTVELLISDSQGCKAPDSATVLVSVGSFEAGEVVTPPTICKGIPYQLEASGGIAYVWSPANVLDDPTIATPKATIYQTTNFTVIVIDSCGRDTLEVTLPVFDDAISVSPDTAICVNQDVQIEVFGSVSRFWTPNTFINNNTLSNPVVSPQQTTYYIVTATTLNSCVFKDSVLVNVFFDPPVPDLEDTAGLCYGLSRTLLVSGATSYVWSPNQNINTISGNTVIVSPLVDRTYYCDFTNICGTVRDSIFIDVITPRITASNDTIICLGDTAYLNVEGAVAYSWSPSKWLNSTSAPDVISVPQGTITYLVIGTDENGCRDSADVLVQVFPPHPVSAGANISAQLGDLVQLNAVTNTTGTFLWSPSFYLSCTTCPDPLASPNYNLTYTVFFTDTNGCVTKDLIDINYQGVIYVPNTFTPDGSKFNEVFKAYGEGIENFQMLIFDRWGELIYTMDSMDDSWDGRYLGKLCQDGTYTWKITYSDMSGEYKTITGHINLLK